MGAVLNEISGKIDQKHCRPIWMMRQAGRYLPEYRAIRSKFPTFLDFCYQADAATEVTLQPISRFGFDAAIIFSDILVIPHALGQKVWFVTGEGPKLGPLPAIDDMEKRLKDGTFLNHLKNVYSAVTKTRSELHQDIDLFGFCGAPWTLLTYMLEGGSSKNYSKALSFSAEQPEVFERLLSILEQAIAEHAKNQVRAGANLIQLFDSWAGGIPEDKREKWSFKPLCRLVSQLSKVAPVVVFPKAVAGEFSSFVKNDAKESFVGSMALAVGQDQSLGLVRSKHDDDFCTQGNIDPVLMNGEWSVLKDATLDLLKSLHPMGRHVVNLGHGIMPHADPENVKRWVNLVKETQR